MDGAVDTLENRVPLRTISGSTCFLVPKDRLQFFHELVFEFLSLIRTQGFRWAEHRKDLINQMTDNYSSFLRFDGYQQEEPREVIDDR